MAARKRKHPRPTKTIKIDADVHPRLDWLQEKVSEFDLPTYVDQTEIVSAAVKFVTPEQLQGKLLGYWRYTNRLRRETAQTASPKPEDD
jgi:hypothetical protein